MNGDTERLRLLSIFRCVLAGLTAPCACLPVIQVVLGLLTPSVPAVAR